MGGVPVGGIIRTTGGVGLGSGLWEEKAVNTLDTFKLDIPGEVPGDSGGRQCVLGSELRERGYPDVVCKSSAGGGCRSLQETMPVPRALSLSVMACRRSFHAAC